MRKYDDVTIEEECAICNHKWKAFVRVFPATMINAGDGGIGFRANFGLFCPDNGKCVACGYDYETPLREYLKMSAEKAMRDSGQAADYDKRNSENEKGEI